MIETSYQVRNSETKKIYVGTLGSFKAAVSMSRHIVNEPLEIVKTTTEVIKKYDCKKGVS